MTRRARPGSEEAQRKRRKRAWRFLSVTRREKSTGIQSRKSVSERTRSISRRTAFYPASHLGKLWLGRETPVCDRATRPVAWRAAWRPGWRVWRPPRGCTWRAAPRRFAVRVRGSPSRTGASPRLRGGPRRRRARRMMARCGGTVDAFARDRCARTRDKSRRWRVSRTSGRGWRFRRAARVSVASTRCGARVP